KLLGALGAWLGWQAILPIVLMASVIGAVIGLGMKASGPPVEGRFVPKSPLLAGGGLVGDAGRPAGGAGVDRLVGPVEVTFACRAGRELRRLASRAASAAARARRRRAWSPWVPTSWIPTPSRAA
ncbi:MAG: A24 family peptidase, partial [Rubrivivax sp.]|nr:A24 family peptidase [Rubrivivax sp.]